jgi:hypothetical protein
MIISNSRSYIFVHIHKTAGTSLASTLDQTLSWNDLILGATNYGEKIQWPYYKRFHLHKHSQAQDIKRIVGNEIWNDYFTFTFVRNPYARALSLYTSIETIIESKGYRRYLRFLPLQRLLKSGLWTWPSAKAYLNSKNFSQFIRNSHFMEELGSEPQVNWIKDKNGKIIVDFIGKVENIHNDLKQITDRIGVNTKTIKLANVSKKKKNLNNYFSSDDDYNYLHEIYKDDFEEFCYDPDDRLE